MKYNNFIKIATKDDVNKVNDILFCIKKGPFKDSEKETIRSFCKHNINNITYTEDENTIYDYYIKTIIRNKHFNGFVDEADVRTIIQYLALKKIKDMNIKVYFKVLPTYLYTIKFGLRSLSSCYSMNDGSSIIFLRDSSFKKVLTSDNSLDVDNLFSLLDNIYHEISHAHQNHIIINTKEIDNKKVLLWIKENLIDCYDSLYYYVNYNNMHIERDADIEGRKMSIDSIKEYFNYFGLKFIRQLEFDFQDYILNTKELKHLSPNTSYRIGADALTIIDDYLDQIALKHPKEIYKNLSIQYNINGKRHSSSELCSEYYLKREFLHRYSNHSLYDEKLASLDELYDYLIGSAKEKELFVEQEHSRSEKIKCRN